MAGQIQHEDTYKLSHLKQDKPIEEHGSCSSCRWWSKLAAESVPKGDKPRVCDRTGEPIGECRCSEPQLASCSENGQPEYEGLWPITYEKDWCGKFMAVKGKGGLAGGKGRF